MAVFKNNDGTELYVDCCCKCNDGIRIRIDKDAFGYYSYISYTNGTFYTDQGDTILKVIRKKLKKIWAIIRNKDFYYAEICMTKDEFDLFKEYINQTDDREVITYDRGPVK